MEQYINKSDIVAEIERRITDNKKDIERASHKSLEDYFEGYEDALALLKQQYLDITETKEVNLEQEIKDILNQYYYFPEEAIDTPMIIRITAKHFYELGLKAKGE
jgi:hypothetical protein